MKLLLSMLVFAAIRDEGVWSVTDLDCNFLKLVLNFCYWIYFVSAYSCSAADGQETALHPAQNATLSCPGEVVTYTCELTQRRLGVLQWLVALNGTDNIVTYIQSMTKRSTHLNRFPEITVSLDRVDSVGDRPDVVYTLMSRVRVNATERLSGIVIVISCNRRHIRSVTVAREQ